MLVRWKYLSDAGRSIELGRGPLDALLVEEEGVEVAAAVAALAVVAVDDAGALIGPHLRHAGQLGVPPERTLQMRLALDSHKRSFCLQNPIFVISSALFLFQNDGENHRARD